jgi:hypothetical protein
VIPPDAKIRKNDQVVARPLGEGEGGVLLHLVSGQYHGLNRVGWMLWDAIDGERTLADIVAAIRRSFERVPAHLEADVTDCLESLLARDLIALSGS